MITSPPNTFPLQTAPLWESYTVQSHCLSIIILLENCHFGQTAILCRNDKCDFEFPHPNSKSCPSPRSGFYLDFLTVSLSIFRNFVKVYLSSNNCSSSSLTAFCFALMLMTSLHLHTFGLREQRFTFWNLFVRHCHSGQTIIYTTGQQTESVAFDRIRSPPNPKERASADSHEKEESYPVRERANSQSCCCS